MARFLWLLVLAAILAAPVVARNGAAEGTAEPRAPPPVSLSISSSKQKSPPPGFTYLEAVIDPERAPPGVYPPDGIAVELRGLANMGTCFPVVRLTVPTERVPEVQALLRSMEPQFSCKDGWCTVKRP
jgi:hypothetical protein